MVGKQITPPFSNTYKVFRTFSKSELFFFSKKFVYECNLPKFIFILAAENADR